MTYATLDHLTDRYGADLLVQLTDRGAVATGLIDSAVVDRALEDTDRFIDGFLGRYTLPLTAVPGLLTDLAQALAIWKLHRFKPDEKIELDYKEALRALRDISAGVITLAVAGVEPAGTGNTGARLTDRERPLTAENLKGFI